MSWSHLPTALKSTILQHLLASPSPINHTTHTSNLVTGALEQLISTNNTELVALSLQAYYNTNTFIIHPQTSYRGHPEQKTFRPRARFAQAMHRVLDRTAPDSGYASRPDDDVEAQHGGAVDAPELASALEKAVQDPSGCAMRVGGL